MVIPESLLKDIGRLFVWFPLQWLIRILPPGKDLFFIKHMGRFYYYCGKSKGRELRSNISSVFDLFENQLSLEKIVLRAIENHFLNQYLVFLFSKFNKINIYKYHFFEGLDNLENVLEQGKPCILLHGHFGPAQLPLNHLSIEDYQVVQIGYHPKGNNLSALGKIIQRKKIHLEMNSSIKIVMADSFLRPIFNHLKKNGILMISGDGVGGGKYIGKHCHVTFLSKTVIFPEGPASLAKKTGALLLPAFTVPAEGNRYKTIIEAPLNSLPGEDMEMDVKKNTQAFAAVLEKYVKRYPYHWHFWDEFKKGRLII